MTSYEEKGEQLQDTTRQNGGDHKQAGKQKK